MDESRFAASPGQRHASERSARREPGCAATSAGSLKPPDSLDIPIGNVRCRSFAGKAGLTVVSSYHRVFRREDFMSIEDMPVSPRVDTPPAGQPGPITFSSQTVAAFIGRTERGPVDQAVTIRNYNHYRQIFGGHTTFSFVSYSVQQFFLHGGKEAVVVRAVNRANRAKIRIPAQGESLEFEAHQPGSREFIRVSIDYDGLEGVQSKFNLVIQRLGRPASQLIEDQEIFAAISVDPNDSRFIGSVISDSRLVRLRGVVPKKRPDATVAAHPGDPIPYLEAAVLGSDGAELTDYDVIGSDREGTGLFALEDVDGFQFLCIPAPPGQEYGITTFLAAERYCERRRAMLIWDPPAAWDSPDAALLGARSTSLRSKNAITYFPRIRSRVERIGLPSVLPACGALAGILAAKDAYGDWRAGAATDPLLKISLAPVIEVEEPAVSALNRAGVNVFVASEYGGSALHGNATLAASDSVSGVWQRLDRRRLLWYIVDSLEAMGSVLFGNDDEAAEALETRILDFLEGLRRTRAIPGNTPSQSYFVRRLLDDTAALSIRFRIGFAMQRPDDFVVYDLEFTPTDATSKTSTFKAIEAEELVG
jgi:hypothetical protein